MKIRVRPVSAPVWPTQPGGETYSEMKFDLTGQRKSGSNGRRGEGKEMVPETPLVEIALDWDSSQIISAS
jgi:hypothetical protein